MKYEHLEQLNKEFAKKSAQINKEFSELFRKWLKKDTRIAMLAMIHFPINMMIQSLSNFDAAYELFPEFPHAVARQLMPFLLLQEKWGKVSNKEFFREYGEIYEKQFDEFFVDEEDKREFTEWYKSSNEKRKMNCTKK